MCLATTFIMTFGLMEEELAIELCVLGYDVYNGLMEEELAIEELCVLGYDVYSDIWAHGGRVGNRGVVCAWLRRL